MSDISDFSDFVSNKSLGEEMAKKKGAKGRESGANVGDVAAFPASSRLAKLQSRRKLRAQLARDVVVVHKRMQSMPPDLERAVDELLKLLEEAGL